MPINEELFQSLTLVSGEFKIDGQLSQAQPYGNGHINDTFLVKFLDNGNEHRYIFQRINHHVFRDPRTLMENFGLITSHLAQHMEDSGISDINRRVLEPIRTRNGKNYAYDYDDYLWRVTAYINSTTTYDLVENSDQAYEVGRVYGEYQTQLLDLPVNTLSETIQDFHNTRQRYDSLMRAVDRDEMKRVEDATAEIRFISDRENWVDKLISIQSSGEVPTRTIHNDTKVNNLLVDQKTQVCICVTDLDTTMPGLILYDFGDMVRTATNTAPEDEPDLGKVKIDVDRFHALTRGYLSSARNFITETEKEYLVFSGKLITYELAVRFLTDYLEGDHYFKINQLDHNLQRCRSQLALVEEIEKNEEQLEEIVESISNGH